MAITTLAGVRSGLQPTVYFLKPQPIPNATIAPGYVTQWATAGNVPAGSYDNTLNGVTLSGAVTGALPFLNPPSGNCYLARFQIGGVSGASSGTLNSDVNIMLCDRLWHNGNIDVTSTSAQLITTPTWPARDEGGATDGVGVLLMLEVSSTVGAATPNITVSYTNSANISGRTATQVRSATVTGSLAKISYLMSLQAGDVGVKSVQSITLDASWISGTINLVAFRLVSIAHIPRFGSTNAVDAITGGMPRLYNDSVLFFYAFGAATASNNMSPISGHIQYTFG